jgi:hypothetical protein
MCSPRIVRVSECTTCDTRGEVSGSLCVEWDCLVIEAVEGESSEGVSDRPQRLGYQMIGKGYSIKGVSYAVVV